MRPWRGARKRRVRTGCKDGEEREGSGIVRRGDEAGRGPGITWRRKGRKRWRK